MRRTNNLVFVRLLSKLAGPQLQIESTILNARVVSEAAVVLDLCENICAIVSLQLSPSDVPETTLRQHCIEHEFIPNEKENNCLFCDLCDATQFERCNWTSNDQEYDSIVAWFRCCLCKTKPTARAYRTIGLDACKHCLDHTRGVWA